MFGFINFENKPESLCFMDYLLDAVKANDKISDDVHDKLIAYFRTHLFDSDAVADDVNGIKQDAAPSMILDDNTDDNIADIDDLRF